MNLKFYVSTAEKERLNKTNFLSQETAIIGEPVDDFDILNPTFTVINPPNYLNGFNYFYCEETQRYYFLDKPRILSGNRVEITGNVDPLFSHLTHVNNIPVIAIRSSNLYNKFVVDKEQITTNNPITQILSFGNMVARPASLTEGSRCFLVALGKTSSSR